MAENPRTEKRSKTLKRRSSTTKVVMEPAKFLTIDLDVRSRRSLAPLMAAWPSAYQPVDDSRWLILTAFVATSAENAAKHLLGHIGKLKGAVLGSWRAAHRRTFDIGVQAGGAGRAFEEVQLSADTLRRIAAVGGQIQVTVYPAEPKQAARFTPPRRARR
jgi:hypothetical protein